LQLQSWRFPWLVDRAVDIKVDIKRDRCQDDFAPTKSGFAFA
jgi:hypothetical protein